MPYLEAFENFEIEACAIAPIFVGQELWGLLCAYQHSDSRHWLEIDVNLLTGIAGQLEKTLQQKEYISQLETQATQMAKAAQVDHVVAQLIPKILQSQDLDTIFRITSQTVRQLLKCDRVAICHCNADGSSDLVAESVIKGLDTWQQWYMGSVFPNTEDLDRHRESLVVNNIYTSGHSPAAIENLEAIEIKVYVITPIFQDNNLQQVPNNPY